MDIKGKKLALGVAVSTVGIAGLFLLGFIYSQRYIPEIKINTSGRFVGFCSQSGGLDHHDFGKPIDIVVEKYKNGCMKVVVTVAETNDFVLRVSGDPRCFRLDWRELVIERLKSKATKEQAKSFIKYIYNREIQSFVEILKE